MLQRSFVLLVLVILAGLWMPPQRTTAQSGCPEGGCKVFLPVVPTPRYVESSVYVTGPPGRGCPWSNVIVAVRNLSSSPITNVVVAGDVVSHDYELSDQTNQYYLKTEDVLFPGESFNYPASLGCTFENIDDVSMTVFGATPVSGVAGLTIEQMSVTQVADCNGSRRFLVTGTFRNATSTTIVNAKVYASHFIASDFGSLDKITLAPNDVAHFSVYLTYGVDPAGDYQCGPTPYPIDTGSVSLHGWGNVAP